MVISGVNIELNNLYYQIVNGEVSSGTKNPKYAILLEDNGTLGLSVGDKYTYKVNNNDTFNFYVLSIEENRVNLIMDRNICGYPDSNNLNNGKPPPEDRKCTIAWYSSGSDNSNGPITVMQGLYNATKDWINVPDMNLDYADEGNNYGSIITSENGIYITKKNEIISDIESTQNPTIIYEPGKYLKSRLPKKSELFANSIGCKIYNNSTVLYGTCPAWLIENLEYFDVSNYPSSKPNDKYVCNKENNFDGIIGYWLLSSNISNDSTAQGIKKHGFIRSLTTNFSNDYGIRPVITIPISDLS